MALPKEKHNGEDIPEEYYQGSLTLRLERVDFAYEDGEQVIEASDFEACPGCAGTVDVSFADQPAGIQIDQAGGKDGKRGQLAAQYAHFGLHLHHYICRNLALQPGATPPAAASMAKALLKIAVNTAPT